LTLACVAFGVEPAPSATPQPASSFKPKEFRPSSEEIEKTRKAFEHQQQVQKQIVIQKKQQAVVNAAAKETAQKAAVHKAQQQAAAKKAAEQQAVVATQQAQQKAVEEHCCLTGYAMLGLTFGASTSYSYSSALASTSDSDSGGVLIATEWDYRVLKYLQVGAELQYSKYSYSKGNSSSSEIGIFVLPRGEYSKRMWGRYLTAYGAIGLGMMKQSVGGGTGAVSGSSFDLAISPRLGAEVALGKDYIGGLQLSFTTSSGSAGTAPVESYTRSWFAFALRGGMRF
jgi:hypothetical protein